MIDFNTIKVDNDTVYKSSDSNLGKIESEFKWMNFISQIDSLKKYVPENINFENNILSMKNYESGDLSKKLLKKTSKKDMKFIVDELLDIFSDFKSVKISEDIRCDGFYSKLIKNRLVNNPLKNKFKYYLINGKFFDNINVSEVIDKCKELNLNIDTGLIHGNLIFSNILIDKNNFKLIDPISDFSEDFSFYGDRRYDLAKLRLSLDGYDYIVNNKYSLSYKNNIVDYKIKFNYDNEDAINYFDYSIKVLGYNLNDIKFIEGLLLLTISSTYKDNFEYQLLYYSLAVEKLGEINEYKY